MRYAILAAATLAVLSAGCVPVTEPLSDIDKAEPDKRLVGQWSTSEKGDRAELRIDVPEVKGNPKGLMRAVDNDPANPMWFYITTLGKHTSVNVLLAQQIVFQSLDKEGEFEKWRKAPRKLHFIFRYTIDDGLVLVVDGGGEEAVKKLMTDEKIEQLKDTLSYKTPPGWLAKFLDKFGPETLFDGSNQQKYHKLTKKG